MVIHTTASIVTEVLVRGTKEYRKAFREMGRGVQKFTETTQKGSNIVQKSLRKTKKGIEVWTKTTEGARERFQFFWLSIMFGAMQAQRFLGRVFSDLVNAYFKITENTTALGKATIRLQGAFTFLQVSIMEALEPALLPLIDALIGLVEWFTSLDDKTKGIIGSLLIFGLIASMAIVWIAQLALVIGGTKGLLVWLGVAPSTIAGVGTALGGLLGPIGMAIIAIVALYFYWDRNITGIQDRVKFMKATIETAFTDIHTVTDWLTSGIVIFFANAWNRVVNIVETGVNLVIRFINGLINNINNLLRAFGVLIPTIQEVNLTWAKWDISKELEKYEKAAEKIKEAEEDLTLGEDLQKFIDERLKPFKDILGELKTTVGEEIGVTPTEAPVGVVPTTVNVGGITINVETGEIVSPADEDRLATKIGDKIMEDVRNYVKYTTQY